jgi:vacuolar-type H+-ATPase subunit I/STV1
MSSTTNGISIEDEIEQEIENFQIDLSDDEYCNKKDDGHEGGLVADSMNVTTNSLLRATICELERALKDTRRLLFDRDKENTSLRHELERTRKELRKEQSARKKLCEETEEKLKSYNEIEGMNEQLKLEVEELNEKLEKRTTENESEDDDPEEIIPCCSSMNELIQMKQKFKTVEKEFEEFKSNNRISKDCSLSTLNKPVNLVSNPGAQKQVQRELQTQLRIKFLRDAFFYYMIDFHPDEQMKAILAILDYDDKRHDIIIESHKMKRQGKRFTVSEVSSRSLTFVQEHTL